MNYRNALFAAGLIALLALASASVAADAQIAKTEDTTVVEKEAQPKKDTKAKRGTKVAKDAEAKKAAEARKATRAKAVRDGWPDTAAGMMGSAWVQAFSDGEDAMRAFYEANVPEEQMTERPMKERIKSYTKLRKRFGYLMLKSVAKSSPEELTVVLLAEDLSPHRFFFEVEKDVPHKLTMVGMFQRGGHGHGGH